MNRLEGRSESFLERWEGAFVFILLLFFATESGVLLRRLDDRSGPEEEAVFELVAKVKEDIRAEVEGMEARDEPTNEAFGAAEVFFADGQVYAIIGGGSYHVFVNDKEISFRSGGCVGSKNMPLCFRIDGDENTELVVCEWSEWSF